MKSNNTVKFSRKYNGKKKAPSVVIYLRRTIVFPNCSVANVEFHGSHIKQSLDGGASKDVYCESPGAQTCNPVHKYTFIFHGTEFLLHTEHMICSLILCNFLIFFKKRNIKMQEKIINCLWEGKKNP